ncbi:Sphingomyelin phosphodiesterase [Amphibalanus amphitrite]|uniref:Sphingomyelin phosphodiesterase n=1 Tax=Amphibalanus amphitrite TaxID=1232801 RepID=A0A6A4VN86_AMPAM|nr:Sphingomyelin phosphodiesterase [Amphibalanus amphitrite]
MKITMRTTVVFSLLLMMATSGVSTSPGALADRVKCGTCKALGAVVKGVVKLTGSSMLMRSKAYRLCSVVPVARSVCEGYIDSWAEPLTYIVQNSKLSSAEVCAIYIDACPRPSLDIDATLYLRKDPTPAEIKIRDYLYPSPATPGLTVLHIADLHLDSLYREGADNSCSEVLCCRADNGFPTNASRRAGRWGDYTRCDSPYKLVESMVQHTAKQHPDVAYIMWTGDNAPHDDWRTSREEVLSSTSSITALLQRYFPGIPVLPVIGNHDSAPINSFPPKEVWNAGFSSAWLYSMLANMWKPWLPPNAAATLENYGYYSLLVRPGFRVIVINTNVAYKLNFWVLMTARGDPSHQLRWLTEELRAAYLTGEKCHIVGHISPADRDILPAWSHMYYKIIKNYRTTVRGEFFSHTHVDEIHLSKDDNDEAFAVTYVAPSLSPWKNVNPGYKVYTVDGSRGAQSTWEVTEVARWTVNLQEANKLAGNSPRWYQQFKASEEYGLASLSPQNWSSAVQSMLLKDHLFTKYYRNLSGRALVQASCDAECRQEIICNVLTSDQSSPRQCQRARATYQQAVREGRANPRAVVSASQPTPWF